MDVINNDRTFHIERVKKNVQRSYEFFRSNYERYNLFRRFVFESSLSSDDISILATIGRPQLEFNVLEAYISRLLGEFSKNEPDIAVHPEDPDAVDPALIKVVEQHLRHVFSDYKNNHMKYEVYKDVLSGGFSVLKVSTDYESPMSMKQTIKIDRVYDPTLCGFDHLSHEEHKGDGRYCFELFPMAEDEFRELYPDVKLDKVSFKRNMSGFNWSYLNNNSKHLLICDYYEKKIKKTTIVETVDGKIMTIKEYNKMVKDWGMQFGQSMTVPPEIKTKRRTDLEKIYRYRFIESEILLEEETDFEHLPLIFVDGNSVIVKDENNSNVKQLTRPYVYHARDAQKLKNYAGVSLANEIENISQAKYLIAKEALPKEQELLDAWQDPQKANMLVFNSVYEEDPNLPINNPVIPVARSAAPPEIMQGFQTADSVIQMILGSYDAALGINNNQLSGRAIEIGSLQSNSASMPYIVGAMNGFQRAAQIYVNLMPKYYTTPRTIPLKDEEGHRYYVKINENQEQTFDFDDNALKVIVEAGASFAVQKSKALQMIKEIMEMSPIFANFIGEAGANVLFDNMEFRGVYQLKDKFDQWMQQQQQKQAQMQQMQQQMMQQNPQVMRNQIEQQKLQLDQEKMQNQKELEEMKMHMQDQKLHADMSIAHHRNATELMKANDQNELEEMKIKLAHFEKRMGLKNKRNDKNERASKKH